MRLGQACIWIQGSEHARLLSHVLRHQHGHGTASERPTEPAQERHTRGKGREGDSCADDESHLHGGVAVAGVPLGDDANDEATPKANRHAEEHLPVLHNAGGVVGKDASKLAGQTVVGDQEDCLHHSGSD